jgi:hypothetical protein
MASPESLSKPELVAQVRKLTQELKRLLHENEEYIKKTKNSVASTESLNFNARALSFVVKGPGAFEVHMMDYDSEAGQGIVSEKLLFDKVHMAEFEAAKLFHTKLLKENK